MNFRFDPASRKWHPRPPLPSGGSVAYVELEPPKKLRIRSTKDDVLLRGGPCHGQKLKRKWVGLAPVRKASRGNAESWVGFEEFIVYRPWAGRYAYDQRVDEYVWIDGVWV